MPGRWECVSRKRERMGVGIAGICGSVRRSGYSSHPSRRSRSENHSRYLDGTPPQGVVSHSDALRGSHLFGWRQTYLFAGSSRARWRVRKTPRPSHRTGQIPCGGHRTIHSALDNEYRILRLHSGSSYPAPNVLSDGDYSASISTKFPSYRVLPGLALIARPLVYPTVW